MTIFRALAPLSLYEKQVELRACLIRKLCMFGRFILFLKINKTKETFVYLLKIGKLAK
jgi:hypothetical protein